MSPITRTAPPPPDRDQRRRSAQQYFQTDALVLCIAIYAGWGLLVDLAVRLLERLLLPNKFAGSH